MSKIFVTCGDVDFQKTLTEREKEYIHEGDNWISKFSRETDLKSLHSLGWTLDEVEALSENERENVWDDAIDCWNNQDWTDSKYRKDGASKQVMGKIEVSKR